jgi:uncharacterized protein (TIGR00730 family)
MALETVCVFCASADGARPEYRAVATEVGTTLARRGIGLVYGGASVGLMGAVADAVLAGGGKVIGVIPHVLVDKEITQNGCTELHVVDTMHARKALMSERSDAFLILPGGFGTFEELFEVLTWQVLQLHQKPICLLNVAGFYDGLLTFLDHCVREGVLKAKAREIVLVADTMDEALKLMGA